MGISDRLKNIKSSPSIVEEMPFNDFITEALTKKISSIPVWYDYDYSKQFELILNFLDNKLNTEFEDLHLSEIEKKEIAEEFLKNNRGFGILDKVLADDYIEAVIVNSSGSVLILQNGKYVKSDLVLNSLQCKEIISRFKPEQPVTVVCQDDLQITLISPPVSDNMIIIKKIKVVTENLSDLTAQGDITLEIENYFKHLLKARKNILITGEDVDLLSEFAQVLINSVDYSSRVVLIEDNMPIRTAFDNVSVFSVSSLEQKEFASLLNTVRNLRPDNLVTSFYDVQKLAFYYLNTDELAKGLVTIVSTKGVSEVISKLTEISLKSSKCTEKQAKLKLSSIYDNIVHITKCDDKNYCLSSVMEVSSKKTSSLVTDEVIRYLDGVYVQDLGGVGAFDDDEASVNELHSDTFLERLRK